MSHISKQFCGCLIPLILLALGASVRADSEEGGNWLASGRDRANTHSQVEERRLNTVSVAALYPKWALAVASDVPVNPAIEGDSIYFPDVAGYLYKVSRDGTVIWKTKISDYTGIVGDSARATPAISGNLLILGNQSGKLGGPARGQSDPAPAVVFAVDKNTGAKVWATQVDDTIYSAVTHSPVVVKGMAIVGVASNEEFIAGLVPKAYWEWKFRGSVLALDVKTGKIKWKTYTVPQGYYGGSVWGGGAAVDLKRNQVYLGTGDNFWAPDSVQSCAGAAYAAGTTPLACIAKDDYFDSIIALDIDTGKINWGQRGLPYDVWNVGCGLNIPGVINIPANDNCPNPKGPDWDFAQAPMLMNSDDEGDEGDDGGGAIVGAGQKSGVFWAFRAKDGKLAWKTQVAPGGLTGGLQWGSAYDGKRIYVSVSNAGPTGQGDGIWTLQDGTKTTAGGWAALNPKNGKVLWTKAEPNGFHVEAGVSVANGVLYGCSLNYSFFYGAPSSSYFALDGANGNTLWSAALGPCNGAPSISKGMVFWGSGTGRNIGVKKFFGMGVPGN